MSLPPHDRNQNAELVARARCLRRQANEVLERAAILRRRADRLLAASGTLRVRMELKRLPDVLPADLVEDDAAEAADVQAWYRAQVREMLSSGWSRAELADVGITDRLLTDLGLAWDAAG